MTTVYVQEGKVIDMVADAAKSAGDVEEMTDAIGVWLVDTASGATGSLLIDDVVTLAKETGVSIAVGDAVYWDATNDNIDATNTNIAAGLCVEAAGSAATTIKVKLNAGA